jgi:serine/threonine-protein kinase RsbW
MAGTKAVSDRPDDDTVELYIPSKLGNERVAVDMAAGVAARMGFPPDRIEDIKTAVAEAVTNAIEHGNELDASRKVFIALVPEGESLQISVRDRSTRKFTPPRDTQPPSIEEKLDGGTNPRGWGTFLIRSLMDEVEYTSSRWGNTVRMVIHVGES